MQFFSRSYLNCADAHGKGIGSWNETAQGLLKTGRFILYHIGRNGTPSRGPQIARREEGGDDARLACTLEHDEGDYIPDSCVAPIL